MSFLIKAYIVIMCLAGLILMVFDKRQAILGGRRVRERTLLLIAAMGGAAGSLVGMLLAWHKVRKAKFAVLVPLFFVLQAALIYILEQYLLR